MAVRERDHWQTSVKKPPQIRCGACPIRHKAICSNCSPDELVALDRIKTYRNFSPGETILWSGEKLSFLGSVVSGVATLSSTMSDGRRQMVGLLLPSDFIGRPGRLTAAYDVVAATDITLCVFQKPELERMILKLPSLGHRLLEMTLDELDSAREWMLLLGRKTAREKIASLFVIMARRDADLHHADTSDGLRFSLHITREAMADYLGLTIETVSRQISALRREKVIQLVDARTVLIPDFEALLVEAADDSDGGVIA